MKSPAPRRRRRFPPAAAVVVLALLVLGGGYALLAPAGRAQPRPDQSLAVQQGRALYLQSCSSCHGLNAEGGSDAPSLIGVGAAAVDFQVGTGRMPLANPGAQAPRKPPVFTQAQIDQLAAYVASLGPGPAIPKPEQYNPSDGDVQEGGDLFRTNCSQCHNASGQGGALSRGKYAPSLEGVTPKHMYEAMLTGPESMPVFGDSQLTPDQKRDIIAFITTIRQQPDPGGFGLGRIGPVSEGLVVFLVGMTLLVGFAIWIGARHE